MKIKLLEQDKLFSKFIRLRAKGRCECCNNPVPFGRLQTSHYHGRRKRSVRWNESNASALCFHCHQHFTESPYEHTEWFKKRLGDYRFTLLNVQANQIGKVDLNAVTVYLKAKLKEMEG